MGMLVLTRQAGERIMVGDDVVITLIEIDRNQVRIGVSAPRETPIHREEVYRRLRPPPAPKEAPPCPEGK